MYTIIKLAAQCNIQAICNIKRTDIVYRREIEYLVTNFNGSPAFIYSKLCFFFKRNFDCSDTMCVRTIRAPLTAVRVGLISISIKDGAHVPLHENAAGILK